MFSPLNQDLIDFRDIVDGLAKYSSTKILLALEVNVSFVWRNADEDAPVINIYLSYIGKLDNMWPYW